MSFEQFMQAQIDAMVASELPADVWIDLFAEQFRADHPVEECPQ